MVKVPSRLDFGAGGSRPTRRSSSAKVGPGSSVGENIGIVTSGRLLAPLPVPRHVDQRQRSPEPVVRSEPRDAFSATGSDRRRQRCYQLGGASLSTLLDVAPHELLSVGLEDVVDLVEEVVELSLDLLALLGGRRGVLDLLGVLLGRCRLADLLSFSHRGALSLRGRGRRLRRRPVPSYRVGPTARQL